MLKQLLPAEEDEWTDTGDLAMPGAMWVFALFILLGRDCFGALRRAFECIVQYKGMFICSHLMCKSSKVQDISCRSSIATEVPAMGERWFGLAQANVTSSISMIVYCSAFETGQIGEECAVETTSALLAVRHSPKRHSKRLLKQDKQAPWRHWQVTLALAWRPQTVTRAFKWHTLAKETASHGLLAPQCIEQLVILLHTAALLPAG